MLDGSLVFRMDGVLPPRPDKVHWRVVWKAKKEWAEYFGWIMRQRGVAACPVGERRRVLIEFYRSGPVSDKDNTYALCKVPLDALVKAGALFDDSPRFCDLEAVTIPSGSTVTVVTVSTVPVPVL